MLSRLLNIHPDDRRSCAWSGGWFATVLSAYYIVRPVREALGSMEGATRLKYFFLAVFLTMLVAVPLYSFLVGRFERRRLVLIVYRFLALNLIGFSVAMHTEERVVAAYVAPVFFVWVSVYVMFLTSLFWSVQADLFSPERGRKLFGIISGCGTAAAIVASLVMGETAELIGPANMLLVSAALMECGLFCFRRLDFSAGRTVRPDPTTRQSANPFQGFVQIVRSPYLRLILLYTFVTTLCSTCLYTRQADMFSAAWPERAVRTGIFARMDFWVLVITAGIQFLIATPLIRWSLGLTACILPLIFAIGFGSLSVMPFVWVLIPTMILSRACTYGLSVPAIGVLYTVVSRDEKYKAKSVIDTLVIRGGDAFTTWSISFLQFLAMPMAVLTGLMVPVALSCAGIGLELGRRIRRAKAVPGG